jgi:probable F420-dependent oxidoreductase
MRPFTFSVLASSAPDGAAWATLARRAESLGYDAFMVPDHIGRQFAPISALAAAAAVTTKLRIVPYVFANDFRNPLVLAGEAATLDVLSGGRLTLGLGAGWRVTDYRALGIAYDEPRIRIDRLVESVVLLRRLWAGETVDHAGVHYRLDGARLAPDPVQHPLPLLIGGGGPRMLRFAAREATIVGLLPQFDRHGRPLVLQATDAATAAKAALVRETAEVAGRWGAIDLNVIVFFAGLVGGPGWTRGLEPLRAARSAAFAAAVGLVGSPYVLHGTPQRVRDVLLRRREAWGLNSYTLPARSMDALAPIVEALAGR